MLFAPDASAIQRVFVDEGLGATDALEGTMELTPEDRDEIVWNPEEVKSELPETEEAACEDGEEVPPCEGELLGDWFGVLVSLGEGLG